MKVISRTMLIFVILLSAGSLNAQPASVKEITYHIGYFDTPPLSFHNPQQSKPNGLAIDLMNEIAVLNQFKIEWYYGNFPDLLEMIQLHQLDALINTGYSIERSEFMDYSSNNFSNVWGQVFLPLNSKVENLFDLEGKTIALMANGVNGLNFINQCDQFEVNCQYTYGNSYLELFQMVDAGDVDGAVSNNLVGNSFSNEYSMLPSSIVFAPFKVFIAVPKDHNPELLSMYDNTISVWKQNPQSFYYDTRLKWSAQSEEQVPVRLWYSIIGLILFGLVAGIAAVLFKRQVNRRVEELSQHEIKLNQIINVVPHMIYVNDLNGQLILANQNACDFLGIDTEQIEYSNVYDILKTNQKFLNLNKYTLSSNPFNTEVEVKDHLGQNLTLMMSKVPYSGGGFTEPAEVTVGVDVSQIKAYEKEINYLAQYDVLTGLPNRELLKERLKSSLARAIQFNHVGAILHVDLDNFKNINDSQGHKVGDKLIKKVALRIKSCLSAGDTIARLGGDEFIIELPELNNDTNTAENQAIEIANSILTKLKTPLEIESNHYHITASVGLVIYPHDGEKQVTLLQRADTAMFEAKYKGRNRIQVFDKDIESRVKRNHQLENDLRSAVQNNEIYILYQPILKAHNQTMIGSEMLLRWQHPIEGLIMPSDFIPIAERSQAILEIGYWTIEQACKQINEWAKATENPFFLAVNLSVVQIRDQAFLNRITELIQTYQIPSGHLEFEVTESILLSENQRSIEIIKQLKLLGIKLSVDDFGTGYATFDYIRKLPLDKIKIDQSFISDIPSDNNSVTIVKTILSMAEEMQLEVVAEGVETIQQIEFLTSNNCDYFQGFHFSKPTTVKELMNNFNF